MGDSQQNYHCTYKKHRFPSPLSFLLHYNVYISNALYVAGFLSNLNSSCQKLGSSQFLNTSLYFFLLRYQELVATLPAAEAHNFCHLKLLSFLPQMFYQ